MNIIDGHCDAIWKLATYPEEQFQHSGRLDVTLQRLFDGGVGLQSFAIFIEQAPYQFERVLESADIFHAKIASSPQIRVIRTKADIETAQRNGQIGALLTLEGADGINGNWMYLRILFQMGVRAIGITWNHANWAADGAAEPRAGGLTAAGKQLVKECEKLGILVDVSHLSERSFWDVAETARKPFYASHSNVYDLCPHNRNLRKQQLEEIIGRDGIIGLTFVPHFVKQARPVHIDDLLRHIEYVCELGGSGHLAFGSDFDGIDEWIVGLSHPGEFPNLREALQARYDSEIVEGWLSANWLRYFRQNLPECD